MSRLGPREPRTSRVCVADVFVASLSCLPHRLTGAVHLSSLQVGLPKPPWCFFFQKVGGVLSQEGREISPSCTGWCAWGIRVSDCLRGLDALFSKSRFQVGRVCGDIILRNVGITHEGCPQYGRVARGSPRGGGAGENPLRGLPCILRVVEDCPPTF